MKEKVEKNKKKYYILGIIGIILLAILIIPNFFVSYIQEVAGESSSKLDSNSTVSVIDSKSYRKFRWQCRNYVI